MRNYVEETGQLHSRAAFAQINMKMRATKQSFLTEGPRTTEEPEAVPNRLASWVESTLYHLYAVFQQILSFLSHKFIACVPLHPNKFK
jgi:hypothetical protein